MTIQGQCMCGAIIVTLDQPADSTLYCHCVNCKRESGASGTYNGLVDESTVKIEGTVKDYVDHKTDSGTPLNRYFCGTCGSPIYSATPNQPGKLLVKMGLFDQVPKVTVEIYCKNKQGWEPSVEGAGVFYTI